MQHYKIILSKWKGLHKREFATNITENHARSIKHAMQAHTKIANKIQFGIITKVGRIMTYLCFSDKLGHFHVNPREEP